MQGNLWVALLLQVRNDRLADQAARADNTEHFVVALVYKRQLEAVLGRVNGNRARAALAVKAVDRRATHARQVHGLLERLDDASVALRKRILDVVQRTVQQHAVRVPCGALDTDRLVD